MSIVLVEDVRTYLGTDSADDPLLQRFVDAAELYVSQKLGSATGLASAAVTQRARGFAATALALTSLPVVSVESVTDSNGTVLSLSDLDVDLAHGLIRYKYTGSGYAGAPLGTFNAGYYTIAYHSGFATLPADLTQAVKSRTAYYWATQRGPQDQNADAEVERLRADAIIANRATVPGFA